MCVLQKDKIEIKVSKDKLKPRVSFISKASASHSPSRKRQSAKGKKSRAGCRVDTGSGKAVPDAHEGGAPPMPDQTEPKLRPGEIHLLMAGRLLGAPPVVQGTQQHSGKPL